MGAAKWNEWGTEQVTRPELDVESRTFVHLIGTYRFRRGRYRRRGRRVVRELLSRA
jgi:hypothetical protein